MYARASLNYFELSELCENIQHLTIWNIIDFNKRSNRMPWSEACTVRLYPNSEKKEDKADPPLDVEDLLVILNSISQENLGFLAKRTSLMNVGLAYTFTLPPPPPNGGG